MKVVRSLSRLGVAETPSVTTLGNFDGVHRGHQEILRKVVSQARAQNAIATVLSFYPHPAKILAPTRAPRALGTLRQRIEQFAACGIDRVVFQRFTAAFAATDAELFVRDYLFGRLAAQSLIVGHSVGFGRGRAGNPELLERLGKEYGRSVEIVGPVQVDGAPVSSSAVRAAIAAGDLRSAGRMLGRDYAIAGRVIHGHHRGQTIGFPTANVRLRDLQLPPDGVYAVRAAIGDRSYDGVANLGYKPTFGDRERSLETYVFDFSGDLYGQRIEVGFVERLRGETKFSSVDELVKQIRVDVEAARRCLLQT